MQSFKDATVVFDLDGTLVDTAPDLVGTLNHVLGEIGCPPVPEETVRPVIAFGSRRMLRLGLEADGRSVDDAELERLFERFIAHYVTRIAEASRPFPGVVDVLDRLGGMDVKLGICTNKFEKMSLQLMDALDLTHHFGAVVGRDTLGVCKPHPGILTGTIERLGGRADRAVMVGDSVVDIETAKAARAPIVAVTFGYTEAPVESFQPDRTIDHFDQLLDALSDLLHPAA